MKILKFHPRITKIMKIIVPCKNDERHENHRLPSENDENRETHKIHCENHENY